MTSFLVPIERLMLKTKLIIGFSSGLLIAMAISLFILNSLSAMEAEVEILYDKELLGVSHIKEADVNLAKMGRALRQMLIAQDEMTRDKARAQVLAARETLRKEMDEARKRIFREENIKHFEQFQHNFAKYNENVEHALAKVEREKANTSEAAKFITSKEFADSGNAAEDELTALSRVKERGSRSKLDLLKQEAASARQFAWWMLVGGLALSIGLGVLIGLSIKRPNDRLRGSVEELAKGNAASEIPHTDYPNEVGTLARAVKVLQDIYRKMEDNRWIKSHSAEIAAALQQTEDFAQFTQTALSKLAPAIGAGHAGYYVNNGEGHLILTASYGYRERKHVNNDFAIGEGLVGQCAMEREPITLTAPQDYIRINSGLGEGPPACVSVMPIIHGERVLGVLEVASFQQFSERQTELIDALIPVLATSMEIMDRNQRTRELLASTQEQAQRMEKQAAQLEEQSVEMEAQQAELLETESWFRSIIETAPSGMLVVDESGMVVLANPRAEALFGCEKDGLTGKRLDAFLPTELLNRQLQAGESLQLDHIAGKHGDAATVQLDATLALLPSRAGRGRCVSISLLAAG